MPSTVVHIFNETTNMPKVGKDFSLYHSSYGVKARHGDAPAPGRLGARLARLGDA
jgi:hypothetical protein